MRLSVGGLACLLIFSAGGFAQEVPNFSGSWVLAWPEPEVLHGKKLKPAELTVVQNERILHATYIEHGKTRTATYYLDGTESKNLAAGGAPSKDNATVKFATLLIESTVQVTKATLQMEQKWQLSPDSRHLIVQITANASSTAVAGFPLGSWENIYNRKVAEEVKSQKQGDGSQKSGVRKTPPSSP